MTESEALGNLQRLYIGAENDVYNGSTNIEVDLAKIQGYRNLLHSLIECHFAENVYEPYYRPDDEVVGE